MTCVRFRAQCKEDIGKPEQGKPTAQAGQAQDIQGYPGTTAQPQQEKAKGREEGIIPVLRFLRGG